MAAMLEKLDSHVKAGDYHGDPIRMFLAGGMAMYYHCGVRYTEDVDASFSKRLLVSAEDLTVDYLREDGTPSALYFDATPSPCGIPTIAIKQSSGKGLGTRNGLSVYLSWPQWI